MNVWPLFVLVIAEMYRVLGRQDSDAASSAINGEFLGQLTVLASERNTPAPFQHSLEVFDAVDSGK